MDNLRMIKLTELEFEYLQRAKFLDPELLKFLEGAKHSDGEYFLSDLNVSLTETFRESFTNELAKVGFNENYELTEEGKLLEELIDKFYFDQIL